MRSLVLALGLFPFASPALALAQGARVAPAPGCLDARTVGEMRQPGPGEVVVNTTAGTNYRIGLAADCPGLEADPDAQLLAREGWVCGAGQEFVRSGERLCPVVRIERIDARDYAAAARRADSTGVTTLPTVSVRPGEPEKRRGFGGSYRYCFDPRGMRSWSEDPRGLTVEVAPRRNAGNRRYRVELAGSCPILGSSPTLDFESGMGIGVICGNPGDVIVSTLDRPGLDVQAPSRLASGARCAITAVYPQD